MKHTGIILGIIQVPLDYLLLLAAGVSAYFFRFSDFAVQLKPVTFGITFDRYIGLVSLVALVLVGIFAFLGLYQLDQNRKLFPDLQKIVFGCLAGLSIVALYIVFAQAVFDSRFLVAVSWVFAILYVGAGRICMRVVRSILYRCGIGARRVVIIGSQGTATEISAELKRRPELGYRIIKEYLHFDEAAALQISNLNIDEIIFTNPRANEAETMRALNFCYRSHIVFKYSADLFDALSPNIEVSPLAGIPIVELKRTKLGGWSRVLKRAFDIVVGCLVIILTSPIMIAAALLIAVETGRPVLYQNERTGTRGKNFFAYKFRSMYLRDCTGSQFGDSGKQALEREKELIANSNTKKGPIYKIADDPRVTPFGKFLRRWSLDELPQFFNVLKGEMSIVGPRPHQPREVAQYQDEYSQLFAIRPGITGLAQISGRSDLSFMEEIKLDLFYLENWRWWLDAVIFIKTPFVVFKKRRVE